MLSQILAYLQLHGVATIVVAFSIISILLKAVADVLQAMGKAVPGWIGTSLDWVGKIVHAINGNVSALKQ